MMVLLDSKEGDYQMAREELGYLVGQLLTPLSRRADFGMTYAIDNGAFAQWDRDAFLALIQRQDNQEARSRCLFVVAPDVVGSARLTLDCFWRWHAKLYSWPLALAIQDGIEHERIPWDDISAVFIGGTTAFKTSNHAKQVIRAAQILRKHVHVGRVNSVDRFQWCEDMGVDSVDGTGISQYSAMRDAIRTATRRLPLEATP